MQKLPDFYCYLIMSSNNRTYIGITNDLKTRIRQHNKLIKGGAKSTRMASGWRYVVILCGFSSIANAQSFEWHWKHTKIGNRWTKTKSGLKSKLARLVQLLLEENWDNVSLAKSDHYMWDNMEII